MTSKDDIPEEKHPDPSPADPARNPSYNISQDSSSRESSSKESSDDPSPENNANDPLDDPFQSLLVFDRLEVGPVRLERKRLIAPYRLFFDGQTEETELIYSYEETVFDPSEAESKNLADMIAAQVALNYGMFCRQIVFRGIYDATDRQFLRDMAENTAREIYVKKFLEPNPFLIGETARMPALKRNRYCRAKLVFANGDTSAQKARWRLWITDRDRHCILSSGGKDSLLSFGLIDEIGREAHSIFINESGRHWFTALNAYRHFKDRIPHTGRVWVNSDRVFSWMLQRMPFIRKNFADIRSDEYPIRLWTVAVFLFGALPLMRKRGIGRLLIGDEYDTTRRMNFQGIPHYDGLFDQSRYFDEVLTRYYLRKGWAVSQFSILRPLSELLIEIILAKRYPHLQEHQTSCHAAHKEGEDRVRPCGRCEKCRRIVGMLTAVDEDPRRCGYTDDQIEQCLQRLAKEGTYAQGAAEASQLFHMLLQKGKIEVSKTVRQSIQPRPETLRMRFDPQASPVEGIPVDLREELYRIYSEYSEGAVRRTGRRWEELDLFADPAMTHPYPFEMDSEDTAGSACDPRTSGGETHYWGELTWPDAADRFRKVDIAILPVGAVEQHGPHLPLDTDAFDAEYLSKRVAEACSDPKPLVLPLIAYGVSYHHEDFKGTLSISNNTLSRLVYDIGVSVARNGFKKLLIINGHGGNIPALNYAAQMINRDERIFVCVDTGDTSDVDIDALTETPNDVHAGEVETSTSLAVRPHLVKMERAKAAVPNFSSRYLDFTSKRSVSWYAHTRKISPTGVMGDPTKATARKGEKIWELMIAHLVAFVEELKRMTLDEIYQRRY